MFSFAPKRQRRKSLYAKDYSSPVLLKCFRRLKSYIFQWVLFFMYGFFFNSKKMQSLAKKCMSPISFQNFEIKWTIFQSVLVIYYVSSEKNYINLLLCLIINWYMNKIAFFTICDSKQWQTTHKHITYKQRIKITTH